MTGLNAYRPYRNVPTGEIESLLELASDADLATTIQPSRSLVRDLPVSALTDMDAELALREREDSLSD